MFRRQLRFLCVGVFIAAAVLSGCTARYIRDAQDHFNRAAETENRLFAAEQATETAVLSQSTAAMDYQLALALVNRELNQNREDLIRDRLYGTGLMLKALCLWRLADLNQFDEKPVSEVQPARNTVDPGAGSDAGTGDQDDALAATLLIIQTELTEGRLTLGARDRVLLIALPGLRDHDRGLRAQDYPTAQKFFESALFVLDASLSQTGTPKGHPVYVYIRLAQLSTCRAWQTAVYRFFESNSERIRQRRPITDRAKSIFTDVKPLYEADPDLASVMNDMARRLGVSLP